MLQVPVYLFLGLLLLVFFLLFIVRLVRYFYKFPMPQFLANLIDNPLRRRIQPPGEMPIRHGIKPGMKHLVSKGYKNIGFITVDLNQNQMLAREEAYRACVKKHKLVKELILKLPYTIKHDDAIEEIASFISRSTDLDAVFFATNYLGLFG